MIYRFNAWGRVGKRPWEYLGGSFHDNCQQAAIFAHEIGTFVQEAASGKQDGVVSLLVLPAGETPYMFDWEKMRRS